MAMTGPAVTTTGAAVVVGAAVTGAGAVAGGVTFVGRRAAFAPPDDRPRPVATTAATHTPAAALPMRFFQDVP